MTKQTACVFACSEAFAFALYVTLKTFFAHSPQLATESDVFIYAYRWSKHTKDIISSCGTVKIIDYDLPADIPRNALVMRFTPALYARFEAFNLLDKYQNVICLDSDILVQKELIGAIDEMTENIGLVKDTLPFVSKNFLNPIEGYDLSKPCFNAGFIVLKKQQFPVSCTRTACWLYSMLGEQVDNIELGDQGIINLSLQKFNLRPYVFSNLWNMPASNPRNKLNKAFIIHSTGHRKFWAYYYFHEWYSAYTQWNKKGGTPVSIRKNSSQWDYLLNIFALKKSCFFQLAPDGYQHPIKFITFFLKFLFHIKY